MREYTNKDRWRHIKHFVDTHDYDPSNLEYLKSSIERFTIPPKESWVGVDDPNQNSYLMNDGSTHSPPKESECPHDWEELCGAMGTQYQCSYCDCDTLPRTNIPRDENGIPKPFAWGFCSECNKYVSLTFMIWEGYDCPHCGKPFYAGMKKNDQSV